jgi:hypothetical protein
MATDPKSTTRPLSPDASAGGERKRRRKVLSCYDCRRRKLQCDRAMPSCGRCTKAGQSANCLYLEEGVEGPSESSANRPPHAFHVIRPTQSYTPAASGGDALARLEYQERRIKQLETALAQTGHAQPMDPVQRLRASRLPLTPESVIAGAEQMGATITDRETMMLRGKSFKTQFHGSTSTGAIIAHIPDLHIFTREAFEKYPALARIRQDMQALEDRTDYAGSKPRVVDAAQLKALLPEREECDHLVHLYLDNYGAVYHILHLPTFWKDYTAMWNNMADASAHLVATVLLMTASAQCLTSTQPWLYTANSSNAREKAVACIESCEDWLHTQSQKHVNAARRSKSLLRDLTLWRPVW